MLEQSHRFAGFAVLKAPDVPSVLLEMGYISSDADQQLLTEQVPPKGPRQGHLPGDSGLFRLAGRHQTQLIRPGTCAETALPAVK